MNVLKGWRFVPQVSAWTSLDLGGCLLSRGAGGSPLSLSITLQSRTRHILSS